eukprot:6212371-Pleurochrysis_carterae.AAC.1
MIVREDDRSRGRAADGKALGRYLYSTTHNLQNYRNSRSKAARGPSWSLRPTQLDHVRLSWRVLPSDSLLPGSLPELPSRWARANESI